MAETLTSDDRDKLMAGLEVAYDNDTYLLLPRGDWLVDNITDLEASIDDFIKDKFTGKWQVDFQNIDTIDTAGAWLINKIIKTLHNQAEQVEIVNISQSQQILLKAVADASGNKVTKGENTIFLVQAVENFGRSTVNVWKNIIDLVNMFGFILIVAKRLIINPGRIRVTSIIHHLNRTGVQAIGIISLITFLVGAIVTQQSIYQLRNFGAEIYVINMIGILVFREVGLLLAAIMVAGRSGSAFTSEIGSMRMHEEIDAVQMMGLAPVEVLVMPRIIALIIALPLLTVIADIAGVLGGLVVAWIYSDITPQIFVIRLNTAVTVQIFSVGLIKAPIMALMIGLVACVEGFKVAGSAESLGFHTTASVVKSIFLVIIMDGIFAVFFAAISY